MPIANAMTDAIGGRVLAPEGPYGAIGTNPMPSFAFGTMIEGPGAEFLFCRYAPVASGSWNQGDVFVFDAESYTAYPATLGSAFHPMGAMVGTLYLGGKVVDASLATGNIWNWTYGAGGVYGIWLQIFGCSLINAASINAQTKPCSTTATGGQVDFPSAGAANSQVISNIYAPLLTTTFTANTTNGSQTITNISSNKNLKPGLTLSGTGIPNGTYIVDMQGASATMSQAATATNASTTITWKNQTFWGTTVNTSTAVAVTSALPGIYPNQTLTATGIAASQTISSITGNPGNQTVNLSANATASGTVSIAATGYYECVLNYPYISAQN